MVADWHQREIGGGGSKAAPRHGGGAAAARWHHQWRQRQRLGRMTKAAVVIVCGGEKKCFCVFSILIVGKEAVCPDGLFVPAVFQEVYFYLISLIFGIVVPVDLSCYIFGRRCSRAPPPKNVE